MLSFALAALLAAVHLVAGTLRFLDATPRSRWLSFASGISVAYVFAHLLPELSEGQKALGESIFARVLVGERHVWLLALLGVVVFYGLERIAKASREDEREAGREDQAAPAVFWLHMASYGLYNVLVGYLLTEGRETRVVFGIAMALHFFVNDYGLRQNHRARYGRIGRWLLALAVGVGAALGAVVEVEEVVFVSLVAFLGGGVVLNVLKEELPEDRKSRFWPFALGAAAYAALLVAL